ncbi:cytochrome P450 [Fomitopsis serialis]|uniref:cytochrome P450 n=1 Tax=Fomitopsis serialis TaxID=139415 RepID=UPI002007D5A8|nr:cytochrome P450 [Neoantrodia serialis]KAH9938481.1 cytochrome P450 [Neoantrodia serialis]
MAYSLPLAQLSAFLLAVLLAYRFVKTRRQAPFPPGPRGWPIIGNVLDIPTEYQWKTFAQWGEKWGDIMSVNVLGQRMVIINSARTAVEVLDRKSSIYSDRPHMVMIGEIVGWTRIVSLHNYGPRFRETRRLLSQMLGSREKVGWLAPVLEAEEHRFLLRVLRDPDSLVAQVRKAAGAIILLLAYGYEVKDGEDPYVAIVEKAMSEVSAAATPAAFLVDSFPILRYFPPWLPGGGWKKNIPEYTKDLNAMCDVPYQFVKQRMAIGTFIPSFTSRLLEDKLAMEREQLVKDAASSLYAGGSDTTVSTLTGFFLAMMCYPEVQGRAQAEIDSVIGSDRLPVLADRARLPYVHALCLELLRWNPVAPLAIPHVLSQDDIYAGYYLPKGTIVMANVWKFLHDPETYANPFNFDPSRFIASQKMPAEQDPRSYAYGFGRRICPGMYLADATVFLAVAMSLTVFDIRKPIVGGVEVQPNMEFTSGVISHPPPFKCSIKQRSAKAEALILSADAKA